MKGMAVEKWTPERRRERTRTALLDAAEDVFVRRGFNGASLDEIAETAGFTRGAIYKNFDGKEDLFFAVMDRINERARERFGEAFELDTAAVMDPHRVVELWQQIFLLDHNFTVLALEVHLYALRNPKIRERSLAQRRHGAEMVARFIEMQAAASGVEFYFPIETLAQIFLVTTDGFSQAAQIDPTAIDLYEKFLEILMPAVIKNMPPQFEEWANTPDEEQSLSAKPTATTDAPSRRTP